VKAGKISGAVGSCANRETALALRLARGGGGAARACFMERRRRASPSPGNARRTTRGAAGRNWRHQALLVARISRKMASAYCGGGSSGRAKTGDWLSAWHQLARRRRAGVNGFSSWLGGESWKAQQKLAASAKNGENRLKAISSAYQRSWPITRMVSAKALESSGGGVAWRRKAAASLGGVSRRREKRRRPPISP